MRPSLVIISLAPTVLSRSLLVRRDALQDLNLDAGAIFPPPVLEKRLLGVVTALVGGIVNPVVDALNPATSTTTPVVPGVTTTPATPTSSNAQAESPSPAATTNNNPTNNAGTSPTPAAGENPANGSSADASAGGSGIPKDGSGVTAGNSQAGSTGSVIPRVITDHAGNSMTITAPVTMTYVTTLPNGVVSTVTETFTPNPATEIANESSPTTDSSKIAAIVGTIVAVFLITFAVAFAFLMMRKRQKRSIQLTRSRPTSASSFGSDTHDWVDDERRNSRTALAASGSTTSFKTAPAYVDGAKLEFPLPPVPAVSRPVSGQSDHTFDFSQYRKSRASIIEDKNQFRRIGQYPDADSYTPFALPPSELSHTEESYTPPRTSMLGERSTEKNFHENYRNSKGDLLTINENPFSDPITVPQTSYVPVTNPLANTVARKSTLWRSATFGDGAANGTQTSSPSRDTMASITTSDYGTAQSHGYDDASDGTSNSDPMSRRPSNSTGRYSYHSAFEAYAQATGSRAASPTENPFADQSRPTQTSPVAYPSLRPDTAKSSAGTSVGSGSRELGATPDPKDLFYHPTSPGSAAQFRMSQDSRASSDGGATVRASHVAYPGLWKLNSQAQ